MLFAVLIGVGLFIGTKYQDWRINRLPDPFEYASQFEEDAQLPQGIQQLAQVDPPATEEIEPKPENKEEEEETPPKPVEQPAKETPKNTSKEKPKDPPKKSTNIHTKNHSYNKDGISINIEHVSRSGIRMWVAHVKLSNPAEQLHAAFGSGKYGGSRQTTSRMAKNNGAILAINASGFSGNYPGSPVVRYGKVYADGADKVSMGITKDGKLFTIGKKTGQEYVEAGAYHTFSFGPVLVENGQAKSFSNKDKHPRTCIGQKADGSYLIIVVDGRRSGWSSGMTYAQLAKEFVDRGAVFAYNLDGGGSTSLVFQNQVLNKPSDATGERPVADIIYIK